MTDPRTSQPLRDAFRAAAEQAPAAADCPPAERIWAAVAGELEPDQTRRVVDHTATCPACAEAWRLAAELAPPAAERAGTAWRRWAVVGAVVAVAAAVLLFLAVRGQRHEAKEPPIYREPEAGQLRSLVPDGAGLPRRHALLRWEPGPAGSRYRLTVSTEDLEVIAQARDLAAAEHLLTPADLVAVPPGARLVWQVEAVTPDGKRLQSASFTVRIE